MANEITAAPSAGIGPNTAFQLQSGGTKINYFSYAGSGGSAGSEQRGSHRRIGQTGRLRLVPANDRIGTEHRRLQPQRALERGPHRQLLGGCGLLAEIRHRLHRQKRRFLTKRKSTANSTSCAPPTAPSAKSGTCGTDSRTSKTLRPPATASPSTSPNRWEPKTARPASTPSRVAHLRPSRFRETRRRANSPSPNRPRAACPTPPATGRERTEPGTWHREKETTLFTP